jgi:hypothetical protein
MSLRPTLLVCLAAACGGPQSGAGGKPLTPAQIAAKSVGSIVRIETGSGMIGTGFVVWPDGRIATNLHIIAGAQQAKITLHDKRVFTDIEVLAADRRHDLAILRIPAKDLPTLPSGDSNVLKAGDRIVAIGNPLGLETTVSDGLISAVREINPGLRLLQISAPISPGSSGGPLFNERGEVVGVTTLFSAEGQNLNFAVPVEYLKPLLFSEKAVPLSRFSVEADLSLLASCDPADVQQVAKTITDAISIGAPLFNQGDHEGCFKVYEKTALELVAKLDGCPGLEDTLLAGLSTASREQTFTAKAWAMRHAFDRILNAINAAIERIMKQ